VRRAFASVTLVPLAYHISVRELATMADERTESEDADLAEAAQRGDQGAFASLLERHHGLVRALVARPGTPPGEVEDLVQETALAAWRRIGELREPARVRAWLAETAINVGRLRARRRGVESEARARLVARELAHSDPGPPEDDDAGIETVRRSVLEALDALPDEARALLLARYVEGLDGPALARRLGIRPDAARARLSRAIRAVRANLGLDARDETCEGPGRRAR